MESFDITITRKSAQAKTPSPAFEETPLTRGVKSGTAADSIIVFQDDMGRDNDLDGVIGTFLITVTGFLETVVSTGGRILSEILSRALRCHMPLIAAAGDPAGQSVKLAGQAHVTLVGPGRENRTSGWGNKERIC